jgi:hypothetical protein
VHVHFEYNVFLQAPLVPILRFSLRHTEMICEETRDKGRSHEAERARRDRGLLMPYRAITCFEIQDRTA